MELVGRAPIAEYILGREVKRVKLVRLPVDGIRRCTPEAGVGRSGIRQVRIPGTRIQLPNAGSTRKFEEHLVLGGYVILRWIPRAGHVLPVARNASEVARLLGLDCNLANKVLSLFYPLHFQASLYLLFHSELSKSMSQLYDNNSNNQYQ